MICNSGGNLLTESACSSVQQLHLHHEALDQPMKLGAIVISLLTQQQEIMDGLRHEVGSELQVDHTQRRHQAHIAATGTLGVQRRLMERCRVKSGCEMTGEGSRFLPGFLHAGVHAQSVTFFQRTKESFAYIAVSSCSGVLSAGL